MRRAAPRPVAYFLRAFPKLSETFILGEIVALKRAGVPVHVIAMEAVREPLRHPEAEALLPDVVFVPDGMVSFPPVVKNRKQPARPGAPPPEQRDYWRAGEWSARLLERWGVEHIHAHFAGPAATMAWGASHRTGIPFSFTAHAKDIFSTRVDWRWLAEMSRRAKAVVTVCDYNRRFLSERLPGARIVRIHNGVDLTRWRPGSTPPRPRTLLSVGRLVPKKGFHVLVEAMALLRDRGVAAHLTIVGDGVERGALESEIRSRALERRVRLCGGFRHEAVLRLMRRSQLVVAPSVVERDGNQDALPTILLEAGACAVPAVATRVAGIPEIVRHRRTGVLVRPDDAAALARALERLLDKPAECRRLGAAAREWIERRFDGRRSVARVARLFAAAPSPRFGDGGDRAAADASGGGDGVRARLAGATVDAGDTEADLEHPEAAGTIAGGPDAGRGK